MSTNGQMWCEAKRWAVASREEYAYAFGPDQIVRYAELPPAEFAEEAIAYLTGASGCSKLSLEGQPVAGSWKTLFAGWQPVGPESAGPARPQRLVHVIVPLDASGSGAAYLSENNCTWRVTVTPYFRMAAVGAVPEGESGIEYRIVGERRDERTGEWQYQIEKREQLVTVIAAHVIEDDAFKTVWQQAFYGVRAGDLDESGKAVALWAADGWAAGTVVRTVFEQKNANCTRDVVQHKTVAKAVGGAESERELSLRLAREEWKDLNQAVGDDAAAEPAEGVRERRRKVRNADGTWDNAVERRTERELLDARTVVAVTGDETSSDVTHENTAVPAELPAEAEGESLELVKERTDGGRWVSRLVRRVARLIAGNVRNRRQDLFERVDETGDLNVASSELPGEIAAARAGVWYEQMLDRLAHLKWRVRTVRHTELPVFMAEEEQVKTPLLTRTRVQNNNYSQKWTLGTSEYGRLRHVMTRGGLLNTERELVTDKAGEYADYGFEDTYLERRWSWTVVTRDKPSDLGVKLEGRTLTRTEWRRAEGGAWLKTTVVRTAPGMKMFVQMDKATKSTVGLTVGRTLSRQRTVKWLFAKMEDIRADAEAFMGSLSGFVVVHDSGLSVTTTYFNYTDDVSFSLSVDDFGLWSGVVMMRSELANGAAADSVSVVAGS